MIPLLIQGAGGSKSASGSTRAPQEEPDSLRSIQSARVLHLLCEGEIEGLVEDAKGIYLDETPLQNPDGSWNFSGAVIEGRTGTPYQEPTSGFSASESENSVGIEVKANTPLVRSL